MKTFKYTMLLFAALLFSCNSKPANVDQKQPTKIVTDAFEPIDKTHEELRDSVEKPQKKQKAITVEDESEDTFFIHEGGDIQEFDENGNPI